MDNKKQHQVYFLNFDITAKKGIQVLLLTHCVSFVSFSLAIQILLDVNGWIIEPPKQT